MAGASSRKSSGSSGLQSALWEAANILRGSAVDRTLWKGYILPLLFFKRICDSQFPEVHLICLSHSCHSA